jgi:hypothetical protein
MKAKKSAWFTAFTNVVPAEYEKFIKTAKRAKKIKLKNI